MERSLIEGDPVLIYGAGKMSTSVLRELLSKSDGRMRPIGFIDDHAERAGKIFDGYAVLGTLETPEAVMPGTASKASSSRRGSYLPSGCAAPP